MSVRDRPRRPSYPRCCRLLWPSLTDSDASLAEVFVRLRVQAVDDAPPVVEQSSSRMMMLLLELLEKQFEQGLQVGRAAVCSPCRWLPAEVLLMLSPACCCGAAGGGDRSKHPEAGRPGSLAARSRHPRGRALHGSSDELLCAVQWWQHYSCRVVAAGSGPDHRSELQDCAEHHALAAQL